MKRIYILGLILTGLSVHLQAQTKRIVLVGNTNGDNEIIHAIRNTVNLDEHSTVLFLGNTVPKGENVDPKPIVEQARAILAGGGAKTLFIPGNHEWMNGKKSGLKVLEAFEKAVNGDDEDAKNFLPKNGCPGPVEVELDKDVRLVIMDTQWWLLEDNKPGFESKCDCKTEMQVTDKLEDIVADNRDKLLIFAGHHTFRSTGIRSGYFGPKQHFFPLTDINGLRYAYLPLPGIGSLYPVMRSVAISRQDMVHSAYNRMSSTVDAILREHPFVIRAAAHESVLQHYEKDGQHYITSGAGEHTGRVVNTRNTPFVGRHTGFAVLEVTEDKQVHAIFYEMVDGKVQESSRSKLLSFDKRPPMKAAEPAKTWPASSTGDSTTAAVYARYGEAEGTKRFFYGNNYRAEWSAPVTLPRFYIKQDPRQFEIDGEGGGKQTTSIRLKDKDGVVWSLRTIVKDPEKVLPPALRGTIAEDAMKDMMSSAHPYSAQISNVLADATGIVRPRVEYYYVPDDPELGYYRPAFANTVVALEERQPSKYGEKTDGTWDLVNDHLDKWKHKVDARSYLRARLMDVLLADFDRHYEQWKWGVLPIGTDSVKTYYAIPKDRDQALFYSDGLIIKLGSNYGMAFMKGLKEDIANIKSLGFVSRDIDAFFLNELNIFDWQAEIKAVQQSLSDTVINNSVQSLPPTIYAAHGEWIANRLKSRRDVLERRGMEFYKFLAQQVNIVGSNKEDVFRVSKSDSGMAVDVVNKDGVTKYHRVFSPSHTDEVYLYGMGDRDSFVIAENVPKGIRVRMIGGKGDDVFDASGRGTNYIYDAASGENVVLNSSQTRNMISDRRDVNNYTFRENHYNTYNYPTLTLGFNIDDGFMAGIGGVITKRGFRADPFTTQHRLTTLVAFQHRAYQIKYNGTFNDAWRHFDVLLNGALLQPALQNFFGLGNETTYDTSLPLAYYRVRYSYAAGDLLLRKRAIHNKLSIALGPSIFYYWNNNDRNTGRILNYASDYGLDSNRVFSPKFYAGGKLAIDFNSIDNVLLPTRGLRFRAEGLAQTGLNESTLPFYRASGDIALYAPLSDNKRFILTLRGGGGHIFSEGYEYWQTLNLGANNFLRGYRKNRFSGTSMAYGSAELRWRLFNLRARVLPGELGLIGFQDAGRVWLRGENSNKWHTAYGGGIYFTPFNAVLISLMGAVSEEERLINASVGMGMNLVF